MNGIIFTFALMGTIAAGGTQAKVVTLEDPHPPAEERAYYTVQAEFTYYDACKDCCGKTDGITASGAKATAKHTIAAPPEYAFGTNIEYDGVIYTVEDRGGSIKGNRFDIYVDSHQEAVNLGRRYGEVKVYY